MMARGYLLRIVLVASLVLSSRVEAVEPIKVLLARGSTTVSTQVPVDALSQANAVLAASGLSSHIFESASVEEGGFPTIFEVNCNGTSSTPGTEMSACAMDTLSGVRDDYSADVVLMVVETMNPCGSVPADMINRPTISEENEHLAYAVVKQSCMTNPVRNMKIAAHEFGHLLSLEHHDSDSNTSAPVADNHAAVSSFMGLGDMTAEASVQDCFFCDVHGIFSGDGAVFPGTTDPAGDETHSNSRRVIEEQSWAVVALYRGKTYVNGIRLPWADNAGTLSDPRREGARYFYQGRGGILQPWYQRETLAEAVADFFATAPHSSFPVEHLGWKGLGDGPTPGLVRPYGGNYPVPSYDNRIPTDGDPDDNVSGQLPVLDLHLVNSAYTIAGAIANFPGGGYPMCDALEGADINEHFVTPYNGKIYRRVPTGTVLHPRENNSFNCGGAPQFRIYSTSPIKIRVFRAIQPPPGGVLVTGNLDEFRVLQPAFSCTMAGYTDPATDTTSLYWYTGHASNPLGPVRRKGHADYGAQVSFWIPARDAAVTAGQMLLGGECLGETNTWKKSYGVEQSWAYAIPDS